MSEVKLPCSLREQISKKGSKYMALTIQLTPTLKKTVFMDPAEVEVVKLYYQQQNDFPIYNEETGELQC